MEVYATAATNGVFSEAKRKWIIRNLQGISLSLDGLPEVHDEQRPLKSGGPSSKAVFQTVEVFERANFPYGIRMTVTAFTVKKVPDSVRYLLDHAHPKQIQIEPVYMLGRGRDNNLDIDPEAFATAFLHAKRIAGEQGIELYYSAARINVITNRFCRSCGEGFNLSPSGNVSACYEVCDEKMDYSEEFFFGYYDTSLNRYIFDEEKIQRLRNRTVEKIPWCQGCFCKWHCAGDCHYKARHAMADGEFVGDHRCEITRSITLAQILQKINESGGVFWAENAQN